MTRLYIIYIALFTLLAARPAAAVELRGQVLRGDTEWSGEVVVAGVVVVSRAATLTIRPGTKVLFRRIDRDRDGVGDSELRVLGRLEARGTAASPIVFASAERIPARKDWSYVLLFASGAVNRIGYCVFRHAFSGLQVHFSTAEVDHNVFINNNEGIRFGRAKLKLDHNTFVNNHIGVRFTRMEGPAEITANEIHGNDTGVFLVPSGQNIVDFFDPGRGGRPWNEGHLVITGNNIHANRDYNLKLGAKQMWDLQVGGNWWGTPRKQEAAPLVYDQADDPELGRALLAPMAPAPITGAGAGLTPLPGDQP